MTMNAAKYRRGFVLPLSLVMVFITTIVVAAVLAYVSNSARETRYFTAVSRCRFAAQSAIEVAKWYVQEGFVKYTGGSAAAAIRIDPRQAEAYNWFDHVSADRRTIGISDAKHNPVTIPEMSTLAAMTSFSDFTIYCGIGTNVQHTVNSPVAIVPIVATAVYTYPDGFRVSATMMERVIFGTGQSPVFDYAYFVNNYGWMNGSSIYINGDMRANGDVSLSGSVVNGFIYAAVNDEVGATGKIKLSSSPKIYNASSYNSAASDRARPVLPVAYDIAGAYDAPKSTVTIVKPTFDVNGNVLSGTVAMSSGNPILNEKADSIPMPFVSELGNYIEFAAEKGGTLSYGAVTYTDSLGVSHTLPAGSVFAHYDGTGPSQQADNADNGVLVLIGTQSSPIRINGPVVVDSDVIIRGYVTGKGTIYSGRNVHIIGDIKYLNAPSWSHAANVTETAAANQTRSNAEKDMLGLVAKGNIVVGDSSTSTWQNSILPYINGGSSSVVESYACHESDAIIGYPAVFQGSYAAVERVPGLSVDQSQVPGGYNAATGQFGKLRKATVGTGEYTTTRVWNSYTRRYENQTTEVTATRLVASYDRKYYETICDDAVVTALKDTAGISQIDAVIYNNHGIFGSIGKSSGTFNLNGSIVCRDEALVANAGNGIRFNWDMRLKRSSDNTVTADLSLPVGPQEPYTVEWRTLPDSANPVYVALDEGDRDD